MATHNLTISHWSRGQEGKGQEEQLLSRQRQHLQDLCGQYWRLQWRFFLLNCLCVLFWCGAENFSRLWIFVTFLALNFFMTVLVFFKKVVVYERPWIFGTFAFCANPQAFVRHVYRSLVVLQVVFSISLILAFSAWKRLFICRLFVLLFMLQKSRWRL